VFFGREPDDCKLQRVGVDRLALVEIMIEESQNQLSGVSQRGLACFVFARRFRRVDEVRESAIGVDETSDGNED
jgi:hypothetical protein